MEAVDALDDNVSAEAILDPFLYVDVWSLILYKSQGGFFNFQYGILVRGRGDLPTIMPEASIYTRVSTSMQVEGYSLALNSYKKTKLSTDSKEVLYDK